MLECRAPSTSSFATWLLCGPMPEAEVVLAASRYGTLADHYFADACNEQGNLDASWRERTNRRHEQRKVQP